MSVQEIALRKAAVEEFDAVAETLGLAFRADPVMTWWIGDDAERARILPAFFGLELSRHDAEHDETWATEDLAAIASWIRPGGWAKTTPEDMAETGPMYFAVIGEKYFERGAMILGIVEEEHPEKEHWYLPFIGARPDQQGRGLGSALLSHMNDRLDREGIPAYLEASSERSRALYLRHGYEVTGEITLPDGGPPIWPMWREPKAN